MSSKINDIDKRQALTKHRDQMKNLQSKNNNELERIQNDHDKKKLGLRRDYSAKLSTIEGKHQKELIEKSIRHQEILDRLDKNLKDVEKTTTQEKVNIESMHKKEIEAKRKLADYEHKHIQDHNQMRMEESSEQTNNELKKMRKTLNAEKEMLKLDSNLSVRKIENGRDSTLAHDKHTFNVVKEGNDQKFARTIFNQKKQHNKEIVSQERNHQNLIKDRKDQYANELKVQDENGKKILSQNKKLHEETFQKLYNKNENTLKKLSTNKEKILHELKGELKQKLTVALEKDKDPFYQAPTIPHTISKNREDTGYILEIEVDSRLAKDIIVSAHGKEAKIQMQREYKFDKNDGSGNSSLISKFETFTQKIALDRIVDQKSITKDYNNGVLRFKFNYA